jgi:hypothetical protein
MPCGRSPLKRPYGLTAYAFVSHFYQLPDMEFHPSPPASRLHVVQPVPVPRGGHHQLHLHHLLQGGLQADKNGEAGSGAENPKLQVAAMIRQILNG